MTDTVSGEIVLPVADEINYEHQLFVDSMRTGLEHAIRCGELLTEQKRRLSHGEFMPWVTQNCNFKISMAENYIKISKSQRIGNLADSHSINDALRLLAPPKEETRTIEKPPKETVFSWPNEPRIVAMWEAVDTLNAGVNLLLTDQRDRKVAVYELSMIRKKIKETVARIDRLLGDE